MSHWVRPTQETLLSKDPDRSRHLTPLFLLGAGAVSHGSCWPSSALFLACSTLGNPPSPKSGFWPLTNVNKKHFRFQHCFLPRGTCSGGAGRGWRSHLRWRNGHSLPSPHLEAPNAPHLESCVGRRLPESPFTSLQCCLCRFSVQSFFQHTDTRAVCEDQSTMFKP